MVMYRVWTEFWRFICPIVGLFGTPAPTPSAAPAAVAPGTAVDALDVLLSLAEVEVDFSLSAAEA